MFADIFTELLKAKNVSANRAAAELGIPKTMVYDWKRGARTPSAENLMKLSKYFGVSMSYLLGTEEDKCEPGDSSEMELLQMLHRAKNISREAHAGLIENFKSSLDIYFRAAGLGGDKPDGADD